MLKVYKDLLSEAKTPLDYLTIGWIGALNVIAFAGIGILLFEMVTDPSQFSNITFGLIDTLGN